MATERTQGLERPEPAVGRARGHGRHPSTREYVRIAVILGVITALEVVIYYIDWVHENDLLVPLLFLFSAIKFSLVVLWFMHLRFDSRTYARFFVMGLAGAVTLFLVMLIIFQVFAD